MIRSCVCHLALFCILWRNGVNCWRNLERTERNGPADDVINTNIQSRAASSFIWSPPAVANNEGRADELPSERVSQRRAVVIRQCTQMLARPGVYKIRGLSPTSVFCYVLIKAPALQRIRLTFPHVNVDCERSGLMLFDGWKLLDRKKPSIIDSIPPLDEANGDDRKLYLCTDNAGLYRSMETSQNIGQILYFLHTGDEFTFQIEFLPDNQVCNVYIGRDDEPISLTLRADRPQNCRVYVSGSARLRLTTLDLDENTGLPSATSTCGKAGTNFVSVQANSTSWSPSLVRQRFYHCDSDLTDFNTPCRYNIIELHSVIFASQSAVFDIDPLPDDDRELWSYYCY